MGVGVFNGGSARIGVDNFNNPGGNVNCTDGESSVINTGLLGIGLNTLGGVAPTCTGF